MKIIPIILAFILIYGCNRPTSSNQQNSTEKDILPVIDIEQALDNLPGRSINFSKFINSIEYIPLETNKNCYVGAHYGEITNLTKKYFFVEDLLFDRKGTFIRKIGKTGKGPGEYLVPRGISLDETLNEFYVYDNYGYRIIVYDLNGTFKRSVPVSSVGSGIIPLGDSCVLMTCDTGARISKIFDYCILNIGNGDTVRIKHSSNLKHLSSSSRNYGLNENILWQHNQSFNYYEFLSDTIFSVTSTEELPRYVLNCGKYKISFDEIATAKTEDEISAHIRITQISESSDYLFFSFTLNKKLYYAYYDKTTGETHANLFDKVFNNDIDGGPIWLFMNTLNDNCGFYYFLPDWAKENIDATFRKNSGYDQEKNKELKNLIERIDEEDNPVIYLMHLK